MRALPAKMPAEKPLSRASENRRSNKPLMEKRRRARINESLSELKTLILDAMKKDSSRHSKLEKADILEMTVKHLQNLQRQQMAASITSDPTVINKFRAGFGECATEVTRFLDRTEGLDASVRSRLLSHLSTCLSGLDSRPSSPDSSPRSSPAPSSTTPAVTQTAATTTTATVGVVTALSLAGDVNNNSTQCNLATTVTPVLSGLQLIPTRLASGDIAFILPSSTLAAAQVLAPPVSPVTTTASTTTEPPDSTADDYERNEPHSSEESSCASLTPPPASPAKDLDDNDEDSRLVIKEESVWRPW